LNSSVVSLSSNPTSEAGSTNVDLSALTVAPFAQVIIQTTTLSSNLTSLGNQLSQLLGIDGALDITTNPLPNTAKYIEGYREFNNSVNSILGNIASAQQMISFMQTLSSSLSGSITTVNTTANYMLVP
jgi:hypothetical protein